MKISQGLTKRQTQVKTVRQPHVKSGYGLTEHQTQVRTSGLINLIVSHKISWCASNFRFHVQPSRHTKNRRCWHRNRLIICHPDHYFPYNISRNKKNSRRWHKKQINNLSSWSLFFLGGVYSNSLTNFHGNGTLGKHSVQRSSTNLCYSTRELTADVIQDNIPPRSRPR